MLDPAHDGATVVAEFALTDGGFHRTSVAPMCYRVILSRPQVLGHTTKYRQRCKASMVARGTLSCPKAWVYLRSSLSRVAASSWATRSGARLLPRSAVLTSSAAGFVAMVA